MASGRKKSGERRQRADTLLVQRVLAPSRERARALILAGLVRSGQQPVLKAGQMLPADAPLEVRGKEHPYVSRGGVKLQGALEAFGLDPAGRVAIDIGASTGGFTDCLLQRGASRVYAVDVGYGQLADSLRKDARVRVMERTNARFLKPGDVGEPADLVVIDASFIGLDKLLPAAIGLLRPGGDMVALVKPQFEVGRGKVGKKGVVRDPTARAEAIEKAVERARALGLQKLGGADSVLQGPQGNLEHFLWLRLPGARPTPTDG